MIQQERIQDLNDRRARPGRYVLYWMQASQRYTCNHALEYAIRQANLLKLPLVAVFGLTEGYPEANERHYAFMLEGLRETQQGLGDRGIQLVVRQESPEVAALRMSEDASLLVTDRGYTRHQKAWRAHVASQAPCPVIQVESDVVVPVESASNKREYSAATLRPKIHRQLTRFLVPLEQTKLRRDSLGMRFSSLAIDDVDGLLAELRIDRSVARVRAFTGGGSHGDRLLGEFLLRKLRRYAAERNDPSLDIQSHQSPYLHFGQVSPLGIALKVQAARAPLAAKDAYLEELVVRRELAFNYVFYNPGYDSYDSLPDWAQRTLADHADDPRPTPYTASQLERGDTADPYWNASMREILVAGKMHNYMRMYWGKKVIEWTRNPRRAFRLLLAMNNRYFLDGRDPVSWASVAWCFGLHDRPWQERSVFGKIRYMCATGLERKYDIHAYVHYAQMLQSRDSP
jgi:deoxyribodipyrimidine photo-lyase